ncbi:fucose 4-O-acetylase [Cryobacterium sp. TMT2-17-1]|uniref:Fucose 4-O-acetylase n=1 Tax=Cryobacterium sandaracinum TaxID=1259247 RepID=A0ABY2JCH9_9MICO|nr:MULTISPECIES: acyltransferase family protein [Cryobacterium]TFB61282.1 fucose 4-O-acetylase [Cryobacterium sp. Sr3]TFB62973.1 fucose 4-O-acetylase [Cryobacterium sp. Hz7]TFC38041.1 fucose 4-O-acetylase [Cryobacterium sp. TMT2-14]TFC51994.1 fucose 4-O-acetylase [Cryobacterium sp. TMT2-17-1]TFC65485.1 fucose 4-O-acetylase [Cryobacterium sp. TMT2-4]
MMSPRAAGIPHVQKRRVPLWDNARWIAIALVVLGHAILKLIAESDVAYEFYLFVYAFHVPLFVAVSGYFARSGPLGTRQLHRLVTDIVLPYVIFETIWTVVHWLLGGEFRLDYSSPSWTLWFLIALLAWRLALPFLVLLRHPLLISVIISVGAGYFASIDSTFALSRTLGLLPFFVFGWQLRQWKLTDRWLGLHATAVWRWRIGAFTLFTALLGVIVANIDALREAQVRQFLLYDEAYPAFGYDQLWAGVIRLGLLLLAFALIVAFLVLMPRRRLWFTPYGAATMYIYLLHSFVLFLLRESGVLGGPQPGWVLPAMIGFSVLISIALSQRIVRRVFHPLIEPRARWLFRKKARTDTGTIVLPHLDAPAGTLAAEPPAEPPADAPPADPAVGTPRDTPR